MERSLFRLDIGLACGTEDGLKEGQNLAQDQSPDDQAQANHCQSTGLRHVIEKDDGGIHIKK